MTTSNTELRRKLKQVLWRYEDNLHLEHLVDKAADEIQVIFQTAQRQLLTELLDGAITLNVDRGVHGHSTIKAVPTSVILELLEHKREGL